MKTPRFRPRRAVTGIGIGCLAVLSLGCSTAARAAAPPATTRVDTQIKVYGNCASPGLEPSEIVLTCADYGVLVEKVHWSSWTSAGATGVGTLVYNDCEPNCAEGHHHSVPGTKIVLTRPVRSPASHGLVWSRIQESPEPPGYQTGPYHGGPQPLTIAPL